MTAALQRAAGRQNPVFSIVSVTGNSPAKASTVNGSPLIILLAVRSNVDCRQKIGKVINPQMTAVHPKAATKMRVSTALRRAGSSITPLTPYSHIACNIY
jgi:hypothetical protein